MKYKIGQILTLKEDITLEGFAGDRKEIPKGSKVIIGADKFAHYFRGGYIQPLPEGTVVEGYDTEGLAEYIFRYLDGYFSLEDALEDSCIEIDSFKEQLEWAFDEIGL